MRVGYRILPAILVVVCTMCLSIPMVFANMRFLVSIRTRLNRLLNDSELSPHQYNYIVNIIANDEILDAKIIDHNMNVTVAPLSDETADYFCDWLDQEEIDGNIIEDTADLIRNIFNLGAAPSRPDEIALNRKSGPAQAAYTGNGVVEFFSRSNFAPPTGRNLYNGIWGFTKGSREYALQCNSIGLNILDVTTTNMKLLQTIPMTGGTTWRDVATNGNYAYVAAQGGSQPVAWVVNLSQLSGSSAQGSNSNPISTGNIKNIGNQGWGHTMNVWNDLLFLNGAGGSSFGCRVFDLRENPMTPNLIATYTGGDCHDSYGQRIGQRDVLFSSDGMTGSFRLLDITNIRTSTSFPKIGQTNRVIGAYAHQNVVSDDGTKLFVFDEFNRFDIGVYDISNLSRPQLISTFQWSGEQSEGNAIVHNGAIFGNYLIVAYYKAGLRVFDISNTNNIQEVGKYETYRDPDGDGNFENNSLSGYDGAWNVAKLQSGKILVSDTVYGTFVVTLNDGTAPTSAPVTLTTPAPTFGPSPGSSSVEPTPPNSSLDPTPSGTNITPTELPTAEPTAEPTRNPTSSPTRAPTEITDTDCRNIEQVLMVQVKSDANNKDTKFKVRQRNGKGKFKKIILNVRKMKKNKINTFDACVNIKAKCYRLKITDKGRDGIENGFVKMYIGGDQIYNNKFISGKKRTKKFGKCKKKNNN